VAIGGFYDGSSKISYASISGVNQDGTGNTSGQLVIKTRTNFGSLTERMRIDSAGNVGIGTSSPATKMSVLSATNNGISVNDGTVNTILYNTSSANGTIGTTTNHPMAFYANNAERMRLDSSGNLLVGTTSQITAAGAIVSVSKADTWPLVIRDAVANGLGVAFVASNNSQVGSITLSTTATTYNTSSDYRLKEDWQPMTGATERVQALKPVNFAWKADGSRVDGFLAHEAQEVVPECVTGTKDAVNAEGKPNYQGIDQSKLVPLLTAALQEALTKIDALTARIEALEGN